MVVVTGADRGAGAPALYVVPLWWGVAHIGYLVPHYGCPHDVGAGWPPRGSVRGSPVTPAGDGATIRGLETAPHPCPSFARRRESIWRRFLKQRCFAPAARWIPACAGMTAWGRGRLPCRCVAVWGGVFLAFELLTQRHRRRSAVAGVWTIEGRCRGPGLSHFAYRLGFSRRALKSILFFENVIKV